MVADREDVIPVVVIQEEKHFDQGIGDAKVGVHRGKAVGLSEVEEIEG